MKEEANMTEAEIERRLTHGIMTHYFAHRFREGPGTFHRDGQDATESDIKEAYHRYWTRTLKHDANDYFPPPDGKRVGLGKRFHVFFERRKVYSRH